MKYELINQPDDKYSAKQQILINRGIKEEDLVHYMNLTDNDINDPSIFGDVISRAADVFIMEVLHNFDAVIAVIVDCDCDGYTSAALLINYIYDLAPNFTEKCVFYFLHEGKQHGLQDAMDWIQNTGATTVIIPDAGSNDWNELQTLHEQGKNIIILDHHEIEGEPYPNCYLINSQLPQYPNKDLSGVGVTWQFCKHVDKMIGQNYADQYLDLVALGLNLLG